MHVNPFALLTGDLQGSLHRPIVRWDSVSGRIAAQVFAPRYGLQWPQGKAGSNVTLTYGLLGPMISAAATGGGGGDSLTFAVAQTAHGFSVGQSIQYGTSSWATASRSASSTVMDGIVSAVADANNFTILIWGKLTLTTGQWDAVTGGTGGLTAGEYYWLDSTAGKITKTAPTTGIKQLALLAISTTVAVVTIGDVVDLTVLNGMIPNASYRTICQASGSHITGQAAGTYLIGQGDPLVVSGTGTLYPIAVVYIDPADFASYNSLPAKMRVVGTIHCNDTAPTGNFTFGLYPITRPGTSGGAGVCIYTAGTVVSGSQPSVVATPAADSSTQSIGSDFSVPSAGFYAIGILTTAAVAALALMHFTAQLQMRNA